VAKRGVLKTTTDSICFLSRPSRRQNPRPLSRRHHQRIQRIVRI